MGEAEEAMVSPVADGGLDGREAVASPGRDEEE